METYQFQQEHLKLAFTINPILVGGGVDFFFNNSARKIFIAMKLLDFLQLLIMQLLKKFYSNILKN